jgi:nitroreductase
LFVGRLEFGVVTWRKFMDMENLSKELMQFIFGRRSVRVYTPEPVSEEAVQLLLQAAMAAPSAVAKDPWRFVVIRQKATLRRIAEALPNGKMLGDAAVGIIVCGDLDAAHDRQLSYLLQDCSAAIENLLLAVHILKLGACWLGIHPRPDRIAHVSQVLGLPTQVVPVAGIAIGHPGEYKEPRTRYRAESVHYEKWEGR